MKNNKHSLYLLVLLLCTSITSVIAQDVTIASPYTMAVGPINVDPLVPLRGDATGGLYTDTSTPGTNRLLVAMVMGEDGSSTDIVPTDVTYGGVAMTKHAEAPVYVTGGTDTYLSMWILKEADLATAVGSTVAVTWNVAGGPGGNSAGQVDCVIFANVDQTTPLRATSVGTALAGTFVKTAADLTAPAGEMIVAHGATANFSGTHAWDNGFVAATLTPATVVSGFGRSLGGTKVGTGAAEVVSYTGTATQARLTLIGAVIKKFGTPALSVNYKQLAANTINVYPNPASNVLNIDSAVSSEKVINVINSLGQVVSSTKSSGNAQIDLKSLNVSGFVIVQVIAEGRVSNHKVIVE